MPTTRLEALLGRHGAVVALWLVAGFLWFSDDTKTRATINEVLSHQDEPVRLDEYRDRAA